ncbi:MAG: EAL domain-containing protein [Gammaproteobacteria bacterium]|nr:EAL domain-containing protein [Gammaproteobacteria bacterium]
MARILIVDDLDINRRFLVTLLGYRGHELIEAANGREGLEKLRTHRPALVVCDILMPEMDGFDFALSVRADAHLRSTPIVFYTANFNANEAGELARRCGVSDVICKPSPPEEILRVVDRLLAQPPVDVTALDSGSFDEDHLSLLTSKLSSTKDELTAANRRLAALVELSLQLGSAHDSDALAVSICNGARNLAHAEFALLVTRKDPFERKYSVCSTGNRREILARIGDELQRSLSQPVPPAPVMARGTNVRTLLPNLDSQTVQSISNFAACPVSALQVQWGWLILFNRIGAPEFDADDLSMLSIIAAHTGRIYENASLYRTIERKVAALAREIEHRKEIEAGLRESEMRFRELSENVAEVFWLTDLAKRQMLFISGAYEKVFGRSREELYQQPDTWFSAVHPEDSERVRDVVLSQSYLQEYAVQYRIVRPDGSIRWILDKGFPVYDDNGIPVRIAGIAEDITDQHEAMRLVLESEARYRSLVEQSADGIMLIGDDGRIQIANSQACELLGYRENELLRISIRDTYVESELGLLEGRMDRVRQGGMTRFERLAKRKDGTTFPAEFSVNRVDHAGHLARFHDISERQTQQLRIARLSRIQRVLSAINSAIVRIRDRDELIEETCDICSRLGGFRLVWVRLLGSSREADSVAAFRSTSGALNELIEKAMATAEGRNYSTHMIGFGRALRVNRLNAEADYPFAEDAVALGLKSMITLPIRIGNRIIAFLQLFAEDPDFFDASELTLMLELANDLSFGLEFIEREQQVNYLAYYDTLTDLPNRALFQDRVTQHIHGADNEEPNVVVVLADIDRFQAINDGFGRQAGDSVLRQIADRLRPEFSSDAATCARISGNRFALAYPLKWRPDSAALNYETKYAAIFGPPVIVDDQPLHLSATLGISVYPSDGEDADTLLINAEAALRAARSNRQPMMFYGREMNASVNETLRLETALKRAIAHDEFVLWYQPKMDSASGEIAGFEALLRWQDPERGLVPPGMFIPLLEQTGMIVDVGENIFRQLEKDMAAWSKQGVPPQSVAVNISAVQLRQRDWVSTIVQGADRIRKYGINLEIELTESSVMHDVDTIIPRLQTLRGMGIGISVDDFGTGYSSLAYLARLPVTALKIDRSFILDMTENPLSLSIVTSVMSLGHSLNLEIIAEGVETQIQAGILRDMGCDKMQGFLFSKPLPAADIPALLMRTTRATPKSA